MLLGFAPDSTGDLPACSEGDLPACSEGFGGAFGSTGFLSGARPTVPSAWFGYPFGAEKKRPRPFGAGAGVDFWSIIETSIHTHALFRPRLRIVEVEGRHVKPAVWNGPLGAVITDIYRPSPHGCQDRARAYCDGRDPPASACTGGFGNPNF